MIGNEAVTLEPEGLGLAFSKQTFQFIRSFPTSGLFCDTLDRFQQDHRSRPTDLLRGFLGWNLLALGTRFREPIAVACFLLFTVLPLPPLLSVPALRRFMAPFTSLDADLE
jgi:hypothetical protein